MRLNGHHRLTSRAIRTTLFLILAFSTLFAFAEQAEWSGKVVGVKDGDTIEVLHGNQAVTIRLTGIDAPEKGQAFGQAAKRLTSDLCFGKIVTVKAAGIDKYGRTLAQVILPDGRNVEEELVRLGFAWHFKKYSSDAHLAALETEAREAQRGLWADSNPVPPWEWRGAEHKSTNISTTPTDPPKIQKIGNYHGNIKSHIFHNPSCRYYDCANCVATFNNRNEAIQAGFRPCKICNP